jgi:hypothetical protein
MHADVPFMPGLLDILHCRNVKLELEEAVFMPLELPHL